MKVALPIALLFCIIFNIAHAAFCDSGNGWRQVFKDDFNTFDENSWTITLGSDAGQGREAWLTKDNVYVQNSNLVLRSQRQVVGTSNYTSGAITSKGKKFWSNARVCVRATLPGGSHQAAQGIWPAHWLMPNDASCWPDHGEVDIMEMINGDGDIHGTFHWNEGYPKVPCNSHDTGLGGQTPLPDALSTYHEYATEWSKDYVTFLMDGKAYFNVTASSHSPSPQFPPSPMYAILNTAVGGSWPGPPNPETKFPAYHMIDYIAVAVRQ